MLPKLDYWKRYDELSDNGQFEEFKMQSLNSEETDVLAFWQAWILFWYVHMRGMGKIRSCCFIKRDSISKKN